MGDYAGARARLEEALAMPALRDDPKKLVYTQHNLANVYRAMGDLDRALDVPRRKRRDCRASTCCRSSDRSTSPRSRTSSCSRVASKPRSQTYRDAVDLSRRARHAEGLVQSLRMLGNALLGLARYDEALPCLQEAAQLFAQLEDRVSEAEMWTGIARHPRTQRRRDEAAQAWSVVLALQRAARRLEERAGRA